MKTVFIALDHGLGISYFLHTKLSEIMLEKDVQLVFLVQQGVIPNLEQEFSHLDRVIFEGLREDAAKQFEKKKFRRLNDLIEFVRRASADKNIPLTYVDTHRKRKIYEAGAKRKLLLKSLTPLIGLLRNSKRARWLFRKAINLIQTNLYSDLFQKYDPVLIISHTAGWRLDKYLLREAVRRGIKSATIIVGWDNPSSQGLPGAEMEYLNVWSELHKREMADGVDWPEDRIHVGGMPLYDNYISGKWVIPRNKYFALHGLDPEKKLITYAATALSITPNLHIIKTLIELMDDSRFNKKAQLLIRLHPNHYKPQLHYQKEREEIFELIKDKPEIKIVSPRPMEGSESRYSGEDFPEKASMLAYSDVMTTIYSTMVVEACVFDTPTISICINSVDGWGDKKFWIPLSEVPNWPTAARVNNYNAGMTVYSKEELAAALEEYLSNPSKQREERRKFLQDEITYLDGEATAKTAEFLLSLIE